MAILSAIRGTVSRYRHANWPVWSIAGMVLTLAAFTAYEVILGERQRAKDVFARRCVDTWEQIHERLDDHAQFLHSGAALFDASERVTRDEWRSYIGSRKLRKTHTNIAGVGYAAFVRHKDLSRYITEIRRDGFADFAVWPEGQRDSYSPVLYLEPTSHRNESTLGFDLLSQSTIREAMEQSRDFNRVALTGKVRLGDEIKDQPDGVLMFVPVYHRSVPMQTVTQRRNAIQGWVYSHYRVSDLFKGLAVANSDGNGNSEFEVFDGEAASPSALIYATSKDSSCHALRRSEYALHLPLDFAGRSLTVRFTPTDGVVPGPAHSRAPVVLLSGGAISVLFFWIALLWQNTTRHCNELSRTKEELRHVQERFEFAMRGSQDGLWDWNLETNEAYFSPRWKSMLGYKQKEITPHIQSAFRLVHPQDLGRAQHAVSSFLSGVTKKFELEVRLQHKKGHYVDVLSRGFVVRHPESEKPIRFVGTHFDMTSQKRQQHELAQFKTTLDQTADCVFIYNAETLRIHYVNRAAVTQLEYSEDALLNMQIFEVEGDCNEEGFRGFLSPLANGEIGSLRYETVHRTGQGVEIPVEVFLQYVAPVGESARFVAVVRDITVYKDHAIALESAKERAERASQAKTDFLATMSHELRTPLNGVTGMTELLRNTNLNARQQRFVDACQKSGRLLLTLVNDILDFSKIEAGKLDLADEEFEILQLVEETVDSIAFQAEDKGLDIFSHVSTDVPVQLYGDSTRLRQVLVNLIGNAIKFTEVGEINVRVSLVESMGSRRVRIEVSDTGVGIPNGQIARLFESFTQADSSTSRKCGGTGLGLSISKSLVEMMGGNLAVASEPSVGSKFWFELPCRQGTFDDVESFPLLCNARVLLLLSATATTEHLTEMLTDWSMTVHPVTSPEDAGSSLQLATDRGQPFDFFIVQEDVLSGTGMKDVLKRLAKSSDEHLVKLLLVDEQGSALPEEVIRYIDGVLHKPLSQSAVLETLNNCMLGRTEVGKLRDQAFALETMPLLKGMRVLLAEDNSTNQLFAQEVVRQAGMLCDSVENGEDALVAVRLQPYDLVLMDCHMPILDGFQATRAIREMEGNGTLDGHMRIIALTANAIKGDRERCIRAGMDDYISKPYSPQRLLRMITSQLCRSSVSNAAGEAGQLQVSEPVQAEDSPIPDLDGLMIRCMQNSGFAIELLQDFEEALPGRFTEISRLIAEGDAEGAAESAHSLKGAAGILGAAYVQQHAAAIEAECRLGGVGKVDVLLDCLDNETKRFLDSASDTKRELAAMLKE